MNLRLYLFVYDVIEKNDGGRRVQDFFEVPQGIFGSELVYFVCVECL